MRRSIFIVGALVANGILLLVLLTFYRSHRQAEFLAKPPDHGTSFMIEADFSNADAGTNGVANLKDGVRRRAAKLGLGIYWEPISDSRIRLMTATATTHDARSIETALFRRGFLEFRLVHEQSDQLIARGQIPSGYQILRRFETRTESNRRLEEVVVKEKPEPGLGGHLVKHAMPVRDQMGQTQIDFALTPAATAAFARVTRENVGRRLAILMDGELYSAPRIVDTIEAGRGQISGQFDPRGALELAAALECPLPAPIKVVEVKSF